MKHKTAKKEIENIKKRIIDLINPKAIILFGSAKDYIINDGSDLDLCVLVDQNEGIRNISKFLYRNLIDANYPIDLIVENYDDFQSKKIKENLIYKAISKGNFIYER